MNESIENKMEKKKKGRRNKNDRINMKLVRKSDNKLVLQRNKTGKRERKKGRIL